VDRRDIFWRLDMPRLYALKMKFANGQSLTVRDVEEFVFGFKYLYVKKDDAVTTFRRTDIVEMSRYIGSGNWKDIALRPVADLGKGEFDECGAKLAENLHGDTAEFSRQRNSLSIF
jgi:hypothetical protein